MKTARWSDFPLGPGLVQSSMILLHSESSCAFERSWSMTEWTQFRDPTVGVVASKLNTLPFDYISHVLNCVLNEHRFAAQ